MGQGNTRAILAMKPDGCKVFNYGILPARSTQSLGERCYPVLDDAEKARPKLTDSGGFRAVRAAGKPHRLHSRQEEWNLHSPSLTGGMIVTSLPRPRFSKGSDEPK